MILAGEKLEEYRELKEYYFLRFLKCYKDIREGNSKFECKKATCSACLVRANGGRFIDFDTITFSHGYAKNRRQFVVELKEIKIDKGRPEWGAEYNKEYFVLKLGEIISKNNYI